METGTAIIVYFSFIVSVTSPNYIMIHKFLQKTTNLLTVMFYPLFNGLLRNPSSTTQFCLKCYEISKMIITTMSSAYFDECTINNRSVKDF